MNNMIKEEISKILSNTKYRFPLSKNDTAFFTVDIPKATELIANVVNDYLMRESVLFAEWMDLHCVNSGFNLFKYRGTQFKEDHTTIELYQIFKEEMAKS